MSLAVALTNGHTYLLVVSFAFNSLAASKILQEHSLQITTLCWLSRFIKSHPDIWLGHYVLNLDSKSSHVYGKGPAVGTIKTTCYYCNKSCVCIRKRGPKMALSKNMKRQWILIFFGLKSLAKCQGR